MKTLMFFLPRSAYSADDPVSPEVAPTTLKPPAVLLQHVLEEVPEELQARRP